MLYVCASLSVAARYRVDQAPNSIVCEQMIQQLDSVYGWIPRSLGQTTASLGSGPNSV